MFIFDKEKRKRILEEQIDFIQVDCLNKKTLNSNKVELITYKDIEVYEEKLYKEYRIKIFDGTIKTIVLAREYENKVILYNSLGEERKIVEK